MQMKNVKLKGLQLENFKCHKALSLEFGDTVTVYGDNATGKSSIYDALTWLLFGRDSHGNGEKLIEVKPLDKNGDVRDHDAITSVEATFDIDGAEMTLRRTLKELWVFKRGNSEPVYDGNTSEYFRDGIPLKKAAFQDAVSDVVSEDVFELLTNVSYFAEDLPWQKRRAVLCRAAGVVDDRAIMATKPEFTPLMEAMGPHDLDDYKKKLLILKKNMKQEGDELPARISECERAVSELAAIDFEEARRKVDLLTQEKDAIAARLAALENDSATAAKELEVREAKLKLSELETKNRSFRAEQEANCVSRLPSLKVLLKNARSKADFAESNVHRMDRAAARLNDAISACRDRWMSVNNETFDGNMRNCPTCGRELPAEKLKVAMEAFEADKKRRLRSVEADADNRKAELVGVEDQMKEFTAELNEALREISKIEADIVEEEATAGNRKISDMEGYTTAKSSLEVLINQLEDELYSLRSNRAGEANKLREAIYSKADEISHAVSEAGKESLLKYSESRIEQLRDEAKATAEKLAGIEHLLFLAEEFIRYKATFVESGVNGLFRIARFRLFREQANGGLEDRCDVTYDGVPYSSVNNGMKINLGIDIINTLSRVYGVSVPLFIDNAECVTKIEGYDGQLIRLVVSENDKELRIVNEN